MLLKKQPNMTEEEFLWMVGQMVDAGEIPNWKSVNDQVNRELGIDEEKWRDESSFRKRYKAAKNFKEKCFDRFKSNEDFDQLQEIRDTIYKEKRKLFDQRREYNKLLTKEARFEHLTCYLEDAVNEVNANLPLISNDKKYIVNKNREGLVCFSDWHYGMNTDNVWNYFNTEICKERVEKTVDYVIEYIIEQKIDKVSIVLLGDLAHGACHVTARIKSDEDTCDQIMHVSEILAEAIQRISEYVNHVNVYSCYGNHMRTVQNKKDSVDSDNMEKLIPWWLNERFFFNEKVSIIE